MQYEKKIIEFVHISKELNQKLSEFNATVKHLTTLHDYIKNIDFDKYKKDFQNQLTDLQTQLKIDKYKTLNDEAEKIGQLLVSPFYIDSLKKDIEALKNAVDQNLKEEVKTINNTLQTDLDHKLKVKDLENDKKFSVLSCEMEFKNKELKYLSEEKEYLEKILQEKKIIWEKEKQILKENNKKLEIELLKEKENNKKLEIAVESEE